MEGGSIDRVSGSRSISVEVLGEKETVTVDARFEERIRYAEIGIGVCAFTAVFSFTIFNMTKVNAWGVICVIACSFCVILVVVFYYKNISRKILKRSLQEPKNVVVLLIATLNFLVDTLRPYDSFSWVNGLMYFFVITGFILIDMTKKKSRAFVLLLGILMLSLTCFNIYGNTIGQP